MNVLVDTSVLLRRLLREPEPLAQWRLIRRAFVSALVEVEAHRTIDRARLEGRLDDARVALLYEQVATILRSCEVVAISGAVLRRAGAAMPTVLGTLDAVHLATALRVARRLDAPLALATHDRQLARAARASGLAVIGDAPPP